MHKHQLDHLKANSYDIKNKLVHFYTQKTYLYTYTTHTKAAYKSQFVSISRINWYLMITIL